MRLYLVQHGEAVTKEIDPDRPLSEQGVNDVNKVSAFLAGKCNPNQIQHSGKTRARQTAEILAQNLNPVEPVLETDGLKPNDDPAAWLPLFKMSDQDLMLVGHLPFMGKMVSLLLADNQAADLIRYRPGSVVCLERDGQDWHLAWMIRPELL